MSEVKRYMQYATLTEAVPAIVRLYPGATQYVLAADHDRIVASLTEAGRKIQAERDQLVWQCKELEVERDEADRRAGAAERKQAEEVDSRRRRDAWLHKAKEAAGYAQKESFDNVWAETLGKANERDTLRDEVERLTGCLQKANAQAEHFEREWYLRGDGVERLRGGTLETTKHTPPKPEE